MSFERAALLLVCALLLELALGTAGALARAIEGGVHGAPLPYGSSPGVAGGWGAQGDFWPIPFAVDVAITWSLLWVSERALGHGAGFAAALGALAGLAVLAWMYVARDGLIGLPLAVAAGRSSRVDHFAAYLDMAVVAAAFALVWAAARGWRRRRRAAV